MVVILTLSVVSACFSASKADEWLAQGDKALADAKTARSGADRNDLYQQALDAYTNVAKDKKYHGTLQHAKAMMALSDISETAEGKFHNPYLAQEKLKELINIFDKSASDLSDDLMTDEVSQVQTLVVQAKEKRTKIAAELDETNSHSIQYKIMDFLVKLTGSKPWFSYWFAVVLLTILVKILITPLTKAQLNSMKEMQKINPLLQEIRQKFKGDQKAIGEKTMELYKEHKINPLAGCLPILIQMPILFGLYYTIRSYEFQFQNGYFLWIGSKFSHAAAVPVPMNPGQISWLTARNLSEPDLILLVLYLVSMYISMKMSVMDPQQAEQQKMMSIMMPIVFAYIFAGFQSAFLFYWLVFNILQTVQQRMIMKQGAAEAVAEAATAVVDSTNKPPRATRGPKK